MNKIKHPKLPAFRYILLVILSVSFHGVAQHLNVMIGNTNIPQEPTICMNPQNTNHLVAGANISKVYYSTDGGYSWTHEQLTSSFGVYGDPCVIVDTAGSYYYFHLSNPSFGNWIDRIVCQKLDYIGGTWSDGAGIGLNGLKNQDKEWAVVDPATNNIYVTWTQFDEYGSTNPADSSVIMFSKSVNGGLSWSNPVRLNKIAGDCIDSDSTAEGAVPAVGPNGEIYVCWYNLYGLWFNKSNDQGNTWLSDNIFVSDVPHGADLDIPGIYRCNGYPVTVCDLSGGPNHGTIYVNWSDQRNGIDDTDVWLTRSTDGGNTWSNPARVNNDPPGKHQFFTWMAIDQTTGYLYFVFYDRRNYSDNNTDVYMAVSQDGGNSFNNFKISESPFVSWKNIFFGDYNNITAHNGVVRPVWTRLDNGQLSIWTAIIDTMVLGNNPAPDDYSLSTLSQNYPNPFKESTSIAFKLKNCCYVSLYILDVTGKVVATCFQNDYRCLGKYIERFDNEKYNLKAGIYFFSLEAGKQTIKKQMIMIN